MLIRGQLIALSLQLALLGFSQSGSCASHNRKPDSNTGSAQSSKTIPPEVTAQMNGLWGGLGISMDVAESSATVQFDCAHGSIGKMALDSQGKFVARGLFVREHPGPTRQGENQDGEPAIYSGTVNGETMTLTIALEGTNETVGTFTLAKGKSGRIRRCG